ncbi:hypothetical protein HY496_00020 [Candidatus Woesearchaeota archaeon]|nr:hypothetical protein [Candidatus Woesearchaeota archaeon]
MPRRLLLVILLIVLLPTVLGDRAFSNFPDRSDENSPAIQKLQISTAPIYLSKITLKRELSCVYLTGSFLTILEHLRKPLWNILSTGEKTCPAGECPFDTEVIGHLAEIQQLLPKLKQCRENQEICAQLAGLESTMKLTEATLISTLLTKIGPHNGVIKSILGENALFQYTSLVLPVITEAQQELCGG